MNNEQIVLNKTDKPNSWEVGKVGNRFKLYFNDSEDLIQLIEGLKQQNLWEN